MKEAKIENDLWTINFCQRWHDTIHVIHIFRV